MPEISADDSFPRKRLTIGETTMAYVDEGDPDGEDRIQVRLPLVDPAADGIWARWVSPDAGNQRGIYWRPEIGDELLVGFLNDDPRDPVVLGMLHSSVNPSPIQATRKAPTSSPNSSVAVNTSARTWHG